MRKILADDSSAAILLVCLAIASFACGPGAEPDASDSKEAGVEIGKMLLPTPRSAVLKEEGYIVWGASMVQADDGVCHLFYCRWRGGLGDWTKTSEIVHTTSSSPLGPYPPGEVVLSARPEGVDAWDGVSSFNPTVMRFGKKYYLYYTGSNGSNFPRQLEDGSYESSPNGTLITQRIGVAVADDPSGPWTRREEPLIDISEDGMDADMTCNPSVTQGHDGRYLMVYKCADRRRGRPDSPKGIYITVATSESPTGPFKKTGRKLFTHEDTDFPAEDPFVWFQQGKYYCLLDDQKGAFSGGQGLIQFESSDGLAWEPSPTMLVCRTEIRWEDGEVEKTHHLERPQLWMKGGVPAVMFLAVQIGEEFFNVHVPLQSPGQ